MGGDVFAHARNLHAQMLACVIFHAIVRLVPSFWAKFFCARDDFEKSSGQVDVRRDFLDMRRSAEWIQDASEQKARDKLKARMTFCGGGCAGTGGELVRKKEELRMRSSSSCKPLSSIGAQALFDARIVAHSGTHARRRASDSAPARARRNRFVCGAFCG